MRCDCMSISSCAVSVGFRCGQHISHSVHFKGGCGIFSGCEAAGEPHHSLLGKSGVATVVNLLHWVSVLARLHVCMHRSFAAAEGPRQHNMVFGCMRT
jgi:sulfopyruvate decarboxylase TPP-binding subunit